MRSKRTLIMGSRAFFKQSAQALLENKRYSQSYKRLSRQLYTKSQRGGRINEIVIGNNTALFATLASIEQHSSNEHKNLHVYCPPFWLDNVDKRHYDLDWGQTIYGLPWHARKIFKTIKPRFPEDKPIRWGDYQALREKTISLLRDRCEVHRGMPNLSVIGDTISVIDHVGKTREYDSKRSYFYNWFKVPGKHDLSNVINRSHIELYNLAWDKLPKDVVVLGYGLSVIWLFKHFPEINFSIIRRRNDELSRISANEGVDYKEIAKHSYHLDEIRLEANDTGDIVKIITLDDKRHHSEVVGDFYSAVGLRVFSELTKKIPEEMKFLTPNHYTVESWKAPENVAFGSLMESFARWSALTDNLSWAYEPQAYHYNTVPQMIKQTLTKVGVDVGCDFFNRLESKFVPNIAHLFNKKTNLKDPVSDSDYVKLFLDTFRDVYLSSYASKTDFNSDLEKIKNALMHMIETRQMHPGAKEKIKKLNKISERTFVTVPKNTRAFHTDSFFSTEHKASEIGSKKPTLFTQSVDLEEIKNLLENLEENKEKREEAFHSVDMKEVKSSLEKNEETLNASSLY